MWRLVISVIGGLLVAGAAQACEPSPSHDVANGRYRLHTPAGWDGATRLPALVYFPGYGTTSADVLADADICETLSSLGVLLIALEPAEGRWSLPHFGPPKRDEAAYVRAVLDDASRIAPIDRSRVMAAGFSVGASMVWYLACAAPPALKGQFAAYGAMSGTFWAPQPDHCDAPPFNLVALHGSADTVFPLHGRVMRNGVTRQGDTPDAIAMLRRHNACPLAETRQSEIILPGGGPATCAVDADCAAQSRVMLCIHDGTHMVEAAWLRMVWHFMADPADGLTMGASLPLQKRGG
jgi:polyhydroxybutyrate depolymerase